MYSGLTRSRLKKPGLANGAKGCCEVLSSIEPGFWISLGTVFWLLAGNGRLPAQNSSKSS